MRHPVNQSTSRLEPTMIENAANDQRREGLSEEDKEWTGNCHY